MPDDPQISTPEPSEDEKEFVIEELEPSEDEDVSGGKAMCFVPPGE